MKKQIKINGIPTLVIGEDSPNALLYLHGKLGYRITNAAPGFGCGNIFMQFFTHADGE